MWFQGAWKRQHQTGSEVNTVLVFGCAGSAETAGQEIASAGL